METGKEGGVKQLQILLRISPSSLFCWKSLLKSVNFFSMVVTIEGRMFPHNLHQLSQTYNIDIVCSLQTWSQQVIIKSPSAILLEREILEPLIFLFLSNFHLFLFEAKHNAEMPSKNKVDDLKKDSPFYLRSFHYNINGMQRN